MLKALNKYPGTPLYGKMDSLFLSETDKAYLAGFIDGEGSISIRRYNPKPDHRESWGIVIRISNLNKRVLEYVSEKAGQGTIQKIKMNKYKGRENQRDYYQFSVHSKRAAILLQEILPYLKIKQKQAKIAIGFQKLIRYDWTRKDLPRGFSYIPEENLQKRWILWEECRKLNSRGLINYECNVEGTE